MKTIEFRAVLCPATSLVSAVRSACRRMLVMGGALCALAVPVQAATVDVTYNSPSDIPISAGSYTATGKTIGFTLNFAPSSGAGLMVIRSTGLNFIEGEFDNLAHGQVVILQHAGRNYYYTANYHARSGRDLMLQWMNVKPVAWGAGANGKLGNKDTQNSSQAVPVNSAGVLWGKLASSGSAGGNHSLGLCTDGTVVSWGLNANGQLGNNSTTPSDVPVAVSVSGVPSTRTVAAVAAGANHSLALCSDGTVVAWGLNANGQLGDNSTTQRNVPVSVNASGALSTRTVVAISAGANHSLALCSDGTVVAWGLNASGQLGDGSTTQRNVPVAITGGVLTGKIVVAISAGASHSLALCSDGTLAAWGLNANGQLGDNSTTPRNAPVAVTRSSGALFEKTVTMISGGGSHSLALCSDGTIASWGLNSSGQLGNGNYAQNILPVAVSTTGALNGKYVLMVSAGDNHAIAHCSDGTVVSWGMGTSGQLGNNNMSNSNVAVNVDTSGLESGGFSGVISGPAANHALAIVSSPAIDLFHCGFHKQITYSQAGTADPEVDPDSPYDFNSYAQQGSMGVLLASSSLTPPVGAQGLAVYEKGTSGLQLRQTFRSKLELDAAFPTGSYLMSIRTSTPNLYSIPLSLGVDDYPGIPKITSVTNATWVDGVLKITNPADPVTIIWNNPGNDGAWFQIDNTNIHKDDGSPSASFIIPGNSLGADSFFRASVTLANDSASVEVAGLPGTYASSAYHTQVRFVIQVGTPISEDPPMYLLMKNHNQVQSSNDDPVDAPNPLPDSDLTPYCMTAESPVGGILLGPDEIISFPLNLHADSDGPLYEYYSPAVESAGILDASCPGGTYTFPGGIAVDMPANDYPATAKILTVNGSTPVWNDDGQLVLDPTVDNTITWSAVSVPNFATEGHQSVYIENAQDFNFQTIEIERGALTEDDTPVTSITIAKSSLNPTCTYLGYIGYAKVNSFSEPSPGVYAVGIYETSNQFMMVALKPQTITFGAIPSKLYPSADFSLGASASSGLPVTYEVISGPAIVSGNTVTLTGAGEVTIRASQDGTGVHASAVSVTQSFAVTNASQLVGFRTDNGLAVDGSQDLLTPAGDGVSNLLKYAFNMIGSGTGQASALGTPNVQIVGSAGNAGLPQVSKDTGKLAVTYIRRKASSTPGISYAVEFSSTMVTDSWSVNASATESVTSIDDDFERVTVTDHAAFPKRFAKVVVVAN